MVREAAASEPVDEEGLRFGVQGLRVSLRARAFEERLRLGAARVRVEGRGGEEASSPGAVGADAGGAGRALASLQPVQLRVLLAAVKLLRLVDQPHSRSQPRCQSGEENFKARAGFRQDQVSYFLFLIRFLLEPR